MAEQKRVRGVDVSVFQGTITDEIAGCLAAEGCAFAYCRAAVGNGAAPDKNLEANLTVFRRHGIATGRYLFPFPLPKLSPVAHAEHHWRLIEPTVLDGDLAEAIDAEWPPREEREKTTGRIVSVWAKWGCTAPQIREWLAAYSDRLDVLSGRRGPLYTYRYWWDCIEGWEEPTLTNRLLWLADYGLKGVVPTDEQLARVRPIRGFDRIAILQHDGDGGLRLPTLKGPSTGNDVDWNAMPDPADLERLRGPGAPRGEASGATDTFLADVARLGHQEASGLIVEDLVAAYRRERIEAS